MRSVSMRQALRLHSTLIVTAAVACACLAIIVPPAPVTSTTPSTSLKDAASAQHSRYVGTSVLGVPPLAQATNSQAQFATLAFYLKSTKITEAFADRLHDGEVDAGLVNKLITVRADPKTATVTVMGYGGSPQQAADVTNAFVTTVHDYITDVQDSSTEQALKDARASVDSLKARIDSLGDRIEKLQAKDSTPSKTDPQVTVLQAQHDALVASYIAAYQRYSKVSAGPGPALMLTVLQPATPQAARAVSPSLIYSLPLRFLLGLLLGLGLGGAAALLLEQYGRKVSSRAGAEEEFRAAVLAEIPKRGFAMPVLAAGSGSPAAAEYRRLRATLLSAAARDELGGVVVRPGTDVPALVAHGVAFDPETHDPAAAEHGASNGSSSNGSNGSSPNGSNGSTPATPVVAPRAPAERQAAPAQGVVDLETRTVAASPTTGRHAGGSGVPSSPWSVPEPAVPVLVLATTASERSHPVVVANVAGSFAESGWDVVVVRCGPAAMDHDPGGLPGLAGRPTGLALSETPFPGVRTGDWTTGDAVPSATDAVEYAQARSELVVVDVGRVDTAEYAEVAPTADGLVVVCELGSTSRDSARRSADLIERSGARFYGVVLSQVPVSFGDRLRGLRHRRSPLQQRRPQSRAS